MRDDVTLYRFLNAKKWDLNKAVTQYKAHLAWRKEFKYDALRQWADENKETCDLIAGLAPFSHHGFDREGNPVYVSQMGVIPAKRFSKLVKQTDYTRYHAWRISEIFSLCREQSIVLEKPIFQCIIIVDVKGATFESRYFAPYFQETSRLDEQNHPDFIKRVYVVNTPWVFPMLYALVKYFIDPNTREKIKIYSSGYETHILRDVDAKTLNVRYGGQNTEPLPVVKAIKLKDAKEDLEEVNISARDVWSRVFPASHKRGGQFAWFVKVNEYDIDVRVEWKGYRDRNFNLIREVKRTDSNSGSFMADTKGHFRITLDNSFSYIRGKQVKFAVVHHTAAILKTNSMILARRASVVQAVLSKSSAEADKKTPTDA